MGPKLPRQRKLLQDAGAVGSKIDFDGLVGSSNKTLKSARVSADLRYTMRQYLNKAE